MTYTMKRMDSDDEFATMLSEEVAPVEMPVLSVTLDFNDLLDTQGEADALRLLGAVKDLLR